MNEESDWDVLQDRARKVQAARKAQGDAAWQCVSKGKIGLDLEIYVPVGMAREEVEGRVAVFSQTVGELAGELITMIEGWEPEREREDLH